jgi:hypothetical protein
MCCVPEQSAGAHERSMIESRARGAHLQMFSFGE